MDIVACTIAVLSGKESEKDEEDGRGREKGVKD